MSDIYEPNDSGQDIDESDENLLWLALLAVVGTAMGILIGWWWLS